MARADSTGNAVSERQTSEARPYLDVVRQIQGRAQLDSAGTDSFEFASKAIDAMAQANSLEELVAANKESGLVPAEDVFNVPLNVTDVSFSKSAEKFAGGGVGAWVIITATLDDGSEIQIKSGAPNVVTFAYMAQSKGWLPCRVKIIGRETQNGTLQQVDLA